MPSLALLGATLRWFLFAAVLVSTGAAAFRFLVVPRLRSAESSLLSQLLHRAARIGGTAADVALLAIIGRLPLQLAELRDPDMPVMPQLRALLFETSWGKVWWAQIVIAGLLAVGFLVARKGSRAGWPMAGLLALALCCTPALSGHAIGSERLPTLAVVLDVAHVIAASLWLGAMFLLAAALTVVQRAGDGATGSALVDAFSPVALFAAASVAVTGLGSSYLHIGAVPDLWRSRYGRTLLLKLAAVGAVVGAGYLNWRRNGPALRNSGEIQPMRRSVRLELALGALVLIATAVLVATPPPGSE